MISKIIISSRNYIRYSNLSNRFVPLVCNAQGNILISRYFSSTNSFNATKRAPVPKHDWNRAVSEAERIVGYPTSFLSLRWLLSDEIANVALHLRKLVGSNHPLLKTAKYLLYNGKNTMQAWGLIVLLISKAAGHAPSIPDMEQDKSAGVLHSQRALAEVTEMVRISHLVHNSLVNLHKSGELSQDLPTLEDMTFGNKIALLGGDYLLAHSCAELARLRNQELVELISSAVRDFTEAEFIGERDGQNNPLPSKPEKKEKLSEINMDYDISKDIVETDCLIPLDVKSAMGIPEKEWALRHILNAGSLLGKSCQGALKLAGLPESSQKHAFLFGKHLSLAWQACLDAEPFQQSTLPLDTTFSLVSAPILFHLEEDQSLYDEIEKGKKCVDKVDYEKIHSIIIRGPGVQKTKQLQKKHTNAAMKVLEKFPPSDARTALENILLAMQDL
ncbi:all trans-polyprenyl-diphosphate synthase PDSS2 [Condylostylus longicornis]|uniref:all trans-polyprenyl-diphosphate synthase PDSS2 n=1 Tax=Condylostylus longicornis TaxID=2530218 RepID=UPI00244E177F|nr:all trans-polyprenyl-diphosphate synthase PDSS2 [Condylostylus longicornis]